MIGNQNIKKVKNRDDEKFLFALPLIHMLILCDLVYAKEIENLPRLPVNIIKLARALSPDWAEVNGSTLEAELPISAIKKLVAKHWNLLLGVENMWFEYYWGMCLDAIYGTHHIYYLLGILQKQLDNNGLNGRKIIETTLQEIINEARTAFKKDYEGRAEKDVPEWFTKANEEGLKKEYKDWFRKNKLRLKSRD